MATKSITPKILHNMKQQVIVPNNYTLCIKGDCPKASNCLRHAAVSMMPTEVQKWSIISPAYLAQMEGECPHYRSAEKVQYARGFVRMMRTLPVNVSEMVMHKPERLPDIERSELQKMVYSMVGNDIIATGSKTYRKYNLI